VFPVRYELDSYILFRRYSVFKGLTCSESTRTANSIRGRLQFLCALGLINNGTEFQFRSVQCMDECTRSSV
jgi:hypothetical protein